LLDLPVLAFADTPDQKGDSATILGKEGAHRFAEKDTGAIRNLKTPTEGVLVREGDEVHPCLPQLGIEGLRIGHTRRHVKTTQKPLGRSFAVASVEVEVGA
jgi:hypothetical protein